MKQNLVWTIEERLLIKQYQIEVVPLVHNISIEHRTKVYSIHVLPSYLFGATSW
jgi:hypothetical protein